MPIQSAKSIFDYTNTRFSIQRGRSLPLGATIERDGINFSIFSKHANSVNLVLVDPVSFDELAEFPIDPNTGKTGDIWHCFITGLDPGVCYGWRVDREPNDRPHLHRFNHRKILIDPYVKALAGGEQWNGTEQKNRYGFIPHDTFDWKDDRQLNRPLNDTIIYELHVRGFTNHPSSRVDHKGTFKGLVEKIPYLKDLGITAVELLPINEFDENEGMVRSNPKTHEPLLNFWGYSPIAFFAPKSAYAAGGGNRDQIAEFKYMVREFHKAGIEIILDVVFNHTAEGNEYGPTFSFKGLDNSIYYIIDPVTGSYHNYSGCGNTMNCNHPIVRTFIMDCLRYWVTEMHVDGFRFDLASILGRDKDGSVLKNPPLLEHIAADPILSTTKIIAEAWDAAGLYQVGSFPHFQRWAEWNGQFRDDVRQFIRGDKGMARQFAKRLTGSADLYEASGRAPYDSINFITSHDGFTLNDLVSYNEKHNELNAEGNADGHNHNLSWNCGVEGPTEDPDILDLRQRQMKNLAVALMLSDGVPMILAGDELGRTQQGNNNAYCQDNEISWVNWHLKSKNKDMFRFFKQLIRLRKRNPIFRREYFDEFDLYWHGQKLYEPDWSDDSHSVALHISATGKPEMEGFKHILMIYHAHWHDAVFEIPELLNVQWHRVVDTSLSSPEDIKAEYKEELLSDPQSYTVRNRSVVVLVGKSLVTQSR